MEKSECAGIPQPDCDFLDYLAKAVQGYTDQKVAGRFAVAYSKKRLAGTDPGDLMRYRKAAQGKGFTVEVGPKARIAASAPAGDPCCEWDWDEACGCFVCVAMC